jgi:hypothetical protein
MQQSLNSYTNQLRSETATLKERHQELLEAYEHAKEDERMKTAVLHKMPDKMAAPVAEILTTAQQVCELLESNAPDISEATETLKQNTVQITTLLDEMIRAAQEERRQAYEK